MTDGEENLAELENSSKQVAKAILEQSEVRLISHNDADGLSAGGIMCNALFRSGILFHTSIVSQFDSSTIELIEKTKSGAVILCDMGSGQSELTSKLKNAIIIDHHKPTGELDHVHFNPHLVGIDGASELSASGAAYMVARQMGKNTDLAGLALVGATGDKQAMKGPNKFILDEAVREKIITVEKGIQMGEAPLEELLEYSVDPYLDITGDREKIKEFTKDLEITGSIKDLPEDKLKKLSSVMVLKLAKQGSLSAIYSLIGEKLILNEEVISNIFDFVNMLNACGKMDKPGIGLSVCMRDNSVVDEALSISKEHQRSVALAIRKAEENIKSANNFRYVRLDDSGGTGIIAGTMTRYLYPDKPFITFNEVEDKIKISARGTRKLVDSGLDLSIALREASVPVGGMGGGHDIASGATIPKGTVEKFIEIADDIIGKQLGKT